MVNGYVKEPGLEAVLETLSGNTGFIQKIE